MQSDIIKKSNTEVIVLEVIEEFDRNRMNDFFFYS